MGGGFESVRIIASEGRCHTLEDCDVLVIGSGAAGLSLALHLADHFSVCVLAEREIAEGATLYAQGGVSAVIDQDDSIESHVEDTLRAGAGLCHRDVVETIVKQGRARIDWLLEQGVPFTTTDTESGGHAMHLTQEGGHSRRRVVHAAGCDRTGDQTTLLAQARRHAGITLWPDRIAINLITTGKLGGTPDRCVGAYVLDKTDNRVRAIRARWSVLATGGAGKVYLYTSNPDVATGDGIAMAWRAGCAIANMEFVQFHPTCLYHPQAKTFLLTEALRGEGGICDCRTVNASCTASTSDSNSRHGILSLAQSTMK